MKFNTGNLIQLFLITSEIIIDVHQDVKIIIFPFYFYLFAYYLRAVFALFCIFYGAVEIKNNFRNGFWYLLIGILFSIFSIGPSIMSLYAFKSIELNLLSAVDQQPFLQHIIHQKYFLATICLIAIILSSAYYLRRRKIT